ncbi:MAG: slipin family protein [Dehalococcoidia bacterium]|nr:slipin family protein [Dehalococcoidia bacterium]
MNPVVVGSLVVVGVVVVIILLGYSIKAVQQYERGVVLRFGRLVGTRKPGLNGIVPFVDKLYRVSLRVVTTVLEPQEVITKDNVTIKVDAVVYFQVVDPVKAIMNVEFYGEATSQIASTTIRSVLGQSDLDELLGHRDEINRRLRQIIDQQTEEPWGVRVTLVEVKDVQLPDTMQRAMAKQAEAEREKRAKIIHAEGEYVASGKLAQAADVMSEHPIALQLRYLQTLVEIAGERSSTIIPLPIDIFTPLRKLVDGLPPAMKRDA